MKLIAILQRYVSIILHPRWWFKGNTVLILSSIKGERENHIHMEKCFVKKSEICFSGNSNVIELNNCEVYNCVIFLRGRGHKLIIEKGARLHNLWIKIIGNENTVHIGSKSSFGSGHIIAGGKGTSIRIGENCMIADGVDIWSTDTHSIIQNEVLINEPASISIGNHVWIGKDVAVLKGVTIGDNAVVGMRSLVTKNIKANTLNVGFPAKEIKQEINWNRSNPNNE